LIEVLEEVPDVVLEDKLDLLPKVDPTELSLLMIREDPLEAEELTPEGILLICEEPELDVL